MQGIIHKSYDVMLRVHECAACDVSGTNGGNAKNEVDVVWGRGVN